MSIYEPLGNYLRGQSRSHIPMTFREIERIIGRKLPNSKAHRAWWSNNPNNNVMTRQWLDAGFQTEAVDISAERLVFKKVSDVQKLQLEDTSDEKDGELPDHPIFGCMEGSITILDGVDLTEPMDVEWSGKVFDE